jgi:ketosteroid isomerase-like protein
MHHNLEIVQSLLHAFATGDRDTLARHLAADIVWRQSGHDRFAGTYHGIDEVLGHLFSDEHFEDFGLEVVDLLASDERVALVARSTVCSGELTLVNEFVHVMRLADGVVQENTVYVYDQHGVADFVAAADAALGASA